MHRLRFYAGLLIGILLAVFALQNLQSTEVRLLAWHVRLPLFAIVIASAAFGAAWALSWRALSRLRAGRPGAAQRPGGPDAP